MLRQLALASFILLTPSLASAQTTKFPIEEATIEDIQAAILRGELTSTRVVQLYLNRIRAYNGTCVNQPDGVLGQGPITPIKNAHQLNALMTLNLRPAKREKLGFDPRKARSMTNPADDDPAMPDALEVAAQQDAHFASTGRLIGPLHGVVFSIKDQYDTFDMRTTAGMDAAYANDRPPRDATFVKRLREAGAIIIAKANLGEMGTPNSRSSFGGPFCNPYDTERSPGTSSGGSGSSVAANLVTCSIGEETGGSIHHPAKNNSLVGLAPTQELVSRDGMLAAGLNTRVGPLCRTVKDAARVLEVIAGYDPKDELTAFSVGRLPSEPYRSFANERTLNGMRIGVIREHMDKKVLNEADVETIDITERAVGDLRRLGATIVDPGAGGALFQGCIDKYVPLYRNRVFIEQYPNLFPVGFQRETVDRPRLSAGGHVFRSIPRAGRFHDPQHRRRVQCRHDQIHAEPLPQGARRCEYQVASGFDRQIEFLSGYPSGGGFYRSKSSARGHEQQPDARFGEPLSRQVCLSASRSAMHGAGEPRRPRVSGGEHSGLHPGCPHRAAVGRQDEFCLGPAGTTRFSDTVRPGGFHHARV